MGGKEEGARANGRSDTVNTHTYTTPIRKKIIPRTSALSKLYCSVVGQVDKQAGTAVRRGGMGKCLNGRVSGDSGRFLRGLCLVFFAAGLGGLGLRTARGGVGRMAESGKSKKTRPENHSSKDDAAAGGFEHSISELSGGYRLPF